MNLRIIIDCSLIAGFCCFACAAFDIRRFRALWAKSVFIISATVGIANGVVELAWDSRWFVLGPDDGRQLTIWLSVINGLLLGLIFSLILSGQLRGIKQVTNQPDNPPNPN
jgi:hypothetical protein